MNSFLIVLAICCGLVYFFGRRSAAPDSSLQTPEQRRHQFVVDVCDGNRAQAQRLIEEKRQYFPIASEQQILGLVYQDMLDLTSEERAAAYVVSAPCANKSIAARSAV